MSGDVSFGRLDDAMMRGYDPSTVEADRAEAEPLDEKWQTALDASIAEAKRLRGDTEQQRLVDALHAQELAERDREWWS